MSNKRNSLTSRIIAIGTAASILGGCQTVDEFKKSTLISTSTPYISLQYADSKIENNIANKSRLCSETYLLDKGINNYKLDAPNYTLLVPKDLGEKSLTKLDLDTIAKQCYTLNGEIDVTTKVLTGAAAIGILSLAGSAMGSGGSSKDGDNVSAPFIPPVGGSGPSP